MALSLVGNKEAKTLLKKLVYIHLLAKMGEVVLRSLWLCHVDKKYGIKELLL
jgi:hypothetical protein